MRLSRLKIGTAGDLLAAIPALLGFVPHDSLVVIVLAPISRVIYCAARTDLEIPDDRLSERLDDLAGVCLGARSHEVMMVVVSGPAYVLDETTLATYRELAATVSGHLQSREIVLCSAWATEKIAAGNPWWSLLDGTRGQINDPQSSPAAVGSVLAGHPIQSTRDDLTAIVAPDVPIRHEVGSLLAQHRTNRPDLDDDSPRARAAQGRAVERLLTAIKAVAAGIALPVADLAEAADALRSPRVRDCMCGLVHTGLDGAANHLWALLTRTVPGPDRAEPAVLLAYRAYVHGDGVLAGIALDVALQEAPTHSVAKWLSLALHTALPPTEIARLVAVGRGTAAELGIALPV